jgi:tetratricopeptide (TPR) repeat protein
VVLRAANERYKEGHEGVTAGLAAYDADATQIAAGQGWAAAGTDEDAARLAMDYPGAGAYVLGLHLHPRERVRWLDAGLAAARRLGERGKEGNHLGNLGIAWRNLGKPHKAIGFYQQSLAIAREIGDRWSEGCGNLGLAWSDLGEPRKAIEFYEKSLSIAREIGDRRGEANVLGNLGSAWALLGDPREAMGFFEMSLIISREVGDRRGEGNAIGSLGIAWQDLDEPGKAIGFYEQYLATVHETGDQFGEAAVSFNLGLALETLGDPETARGHMQHALALYELMESPHAETARAWLARHP